MPAELLSCAVKPLEDATELIALSIAECDFTGQSASAVVIEQVLFRHAQLCRVRLPRMRMSDTRVEASDLSSAIFQKARWNRVVFTGCRLTGIQLPEFNGADILFKDCTMESALFTAGRFRSVRFERCTLRRVFFEKMNLTGAVFLKCDMAGVDFPNSELKGADFRGSEVGEMHVEGRQLQGTIIDPLQAIQIVSLLGVSVKELGD